MEDKIRNGSTNQHESQIIKINQLEGCDLVFQYLLPHTPHTLKTAKIISLIY